MHNLATIGGKVAMMYHGGAPWHVLGTRVPQCRVVKVAMDSASLSGWNLEKQPMFLANGQQVPDRVAIVRGLDGAVISTANTSYEILHHEQAFDDMLQPACDEYGVTIETAGALGIGGTVWMLAKLPDTNGEIVPGDKVQPYFLIATSHDGTRSYTAVSTPIRVVCQNTLNAVNTRGAIRIRHTANAKHRLAEVKRMIEGLAKSYHTTCDTYKALAKQTVTLAEVVDYTERLFPVAKADESTAVVAELLGARSDKAERVSRNEEAREIVMELLANGKGADLAGRTAWGAYNAVTEYVDHVAVSTKAGTLRKNGAQSALFGYGNDVKQRALDLAVETWINN